MAKKKDFKYELGQKLRVYKEMFKAEGETVEVEVVAVQESSRMVQVKGLGSDPSKAFWIAHSRIEGAA